MGWQQLENGALLAAAESGAFDILITCDQNVLPHQQNFANRKIALAVLSSNHWPTLRRVAERIANVVDFAQRGQVLRVDVSAF